MRIFLFLLLITVSFNASAQITFEGTEYGNGYKHARAVDLTETPTHEFIYSAGTTMHMGFTGYNYLAKLDASGNRIWNKNYSVCGNEGTGLVNIMNNGSYLISGSGDQFCQGQELIFMYLVNMDTSGNILWWKTLGGDTMNVNYNDVISDIDGGIVAAGNVLYDTVALSYQAFYKLDGAGNLQYERQYNNGEHFWNIIQMLDSSYYILGYQGTDPAVFYLDKNGYLDSMFLVPDNFGTGVNNLIRDFKFKDNIFYGCISTVDSNLNRINFFFEYDISNGNLKEYAANGLVLNFYPLDNKQKLILSTCPNQNNGQTFAPPVNSFFEKVDSNQTPLWTYCLHPQFLILSTQFKMSSDGGCLLASAIDSFFADQYESMYYMKLDSNGNLLNSVWMDDENTFSLFPNPFESEFRYKTVMNINSISIYDLAGRKVYNQENNFDGIIKTNFVDGLYFMIVDSDKGRMVRKIICEKLSK